MRYNFKQPDANYFISQMVLRGVPATDIVVFDDFDEMDRKARKSVGIDETHVCLDVNTDHFKIADEVCKQMRRIRVKLHICDQAGTALNQRLLYDGESAEIAQIVYEAICVTIEHAAKNRPLRAVYITKDGAVKSYGKKDTI